MYHQRLLSRVSVFSYPSKRQSWLPAPIVHWSILKFVEAARDSLTLRKHSRSFAYQSESIDDKTEPLSCCEESRDASDIPDIISSVTNARGRKSSIRSGRKSQIAQFSINSVKSTGNRLVSVIASELQSELIGLIFCFILFIFIPDRALAILN